MSLTASSVINDPADTPTHWAIDQVHTRVRFDARYLLITSVSGWFRELEGTVISHRSDFSACEVQLVIYSESLYTGVEERDTHLRSADFFDCERFPRILFQSTSVRAKEDKLLINGELTIKGISLPIAFDARYHGTVSDPMGNTKAGFEADIVFDRRLFNIHWNQFFDRNGILISDEVRLHADIQLLRL